MRKLFLLISFLIVAPLFFILNLLLFFYLTKDNLSLSKKNQEPPIVYAALPTTQDALLVNIESKDTRTESVRQFFARYGSVLEPFAQNVVLAADKYNLDYRLIPAIAMQESNLCKKAPSNSFNCWGFGIYGKKVKAFESYQEAIDIVTKTLARYYKNNGLETTEEIMTKYTPSNDGSWAKSVNYFISQL